MNPPTKLEMREKARHRGDLDAMHAATRQKAAQSHAQATVMDVAEGKVRIIPPDEVIARLRARPINRA